MNIFNKLFYLFLIPMVPLIGSSYDQHVIGEGSIARNFSETDFYLRDREFLMNGRAQALTSLTVQEEDNKDLKHAYPVLIDPSSEGIEVLPLPTDEFEIQYKGFKDKYILGTFFYNRNQRDERLFLYDIDQKELINISELAKKQGIDMYAPQYDRSYFLRMNNSGAIFGTFSSSSTQTWGDCHMFAYYPDRGFRIIDPQEYGFKPSYLMTLKPILNDRGQIILNGFESGPDWFEMKYYLYDPDNGMSELKEVEDLRSNLISDNDVDVWNRHYYFHICHLNDRGDMIIEFQYDFLNGSCIEKVGKFYHYNLYEKNLSLIVELEGQYKYFINSQGDLLTEFYNYGVIPNQYQNHLWSRDSHDLTSAPLAKVFGLDDKRRVVGLDSEWRPAIWSNETGVQYFSDIVDSPVDLDEVLIYDISMSRSGDILLEYENNSDEEPHQLMFLVPKNELYLNDGPIATQSCLQ